MMFVLSIEQLYTAFTLIKIHLKMNDFMLQSLYGGES